MKKIISILLAMAMVFGCTACGDSPAKESSEPQSYTLKKNNINLEYYDSDQYEDSFSEYLQITGLKDETIQADINNQLKTTYEDLAAWKTIPKYRGIQLELKKIEGLEPNYDSAYTSAYCNVGNILSVVYEVQRSYENPENGYYTNINVRKPMNFDLNTGKQIKITDLFKSGVDGIQYINDKINSIINNTESSEEDFFYEDGWESFKLVGEFSGISEDQAFYVSNYGDTVYLILDDNAPWAQLYSFYPGYIAIDISTVSNLYDGFVKDNIYLDETTNYVFTNNELDQYGRNIDEKTDANYLGKEGAYFEKRITTYEELTDAQIELMKNFAEKAEAEGKAFVEANVKDHYSGNVIISTYANRVGPFINIDLYKYFSFYSQYGYGDEYTADYDQQSLVFREGSDEEVKLEDLFVPGYDFSTWEFDPTDGFSFSVGNESLHFQKGDEFHGVEYKEIGCDNLTIF